MRLLAPKRSGARIAWYGYFVVVIMDPKRGHIWMQRWIDTHRMRKAARLALEKIRAEHHRYQQLEFNFDT